jgi:hypothetical protein
MELEGDMCVGQFYAGGSVDDASEVGRELLRVVSEVMTESNAEIQLMHVFLIVKPPLIFPHSATTL